MTTQTITSTLLLICVATTLIVVEAQRGGKWQPAGEADGGKEQVDRLTSATGDLIWPGAVAAPGQLEWLLLQQVPGNSGNTNGHLQQRAQPSDNLYLDNSGNSNLPSSTVVVGLDGPAASMRTYHDDLVEEFKQYARGLLVNPSRESRAFKPKLMSTARGFGKRAAMPSQSRITYSDLLEAANPNGAIQSHGKMSEAALR